MFHWDGNLLLALTGIEKAGRLAIIVTVLAKEQLLGILEIPTSSADQQTMAVYQTVEKWVITDKIGTLQCYDSKQRRTSTWCLYKSRNMIEWWPVHNHIIQVVLTHCWLTHWGVQHLLQTWRLSKDLEKSRWNKIYITGINERPNGVHPIFFDFLNISFIRRYKSLIVSMGELSLLFTSPFIQTPSGYLIPFVTITAPHLIFAYGQIFAERVNLRHTAPLREFIHRYLLTVIFTAFLGRLRFRFSFYHVGFYFWSSIEMKIVPTFSCLSIKRDVTLQNYWIVDFYRFITQGDAPEPTADCPTLPFPISGSINKIPSHVMIEILSPRGSQVLKLVKWGRANIRNGAVTHIKQFRINYSYIMRNILLVILHVIVFHIH